MPSSITIRSADDVISCRDRLLYDWRGMRGSNRISKLSGRRSSGNITIDVRSRCFATGKNQTQNQPTANSTKEQHGAERATSRSRNSRSYEHGRNGGMEDWKGGRLGGWKHGASGSGETLGLAALLPPFQSSTLPSFHPSILPPFHPSSLPILPPFPSLPLTKAPPHFQTSESVCRNESARESAAAVESTRSAADGSP